MLNEMNERLAEFNEWVVFAQSLKELPEGVWELNIEEGKWSIRDIVSHIMMWDKYFYEKAIERITLDKPITLKHLNFDEFNSRAVEYGRTITTEDLIRNTIYYRKKLIQQIRELNEELVFKKYMDVDGNVFYIPQYLKDFIWHDQHHMKPLKEFIKTLEEINL